MSEHTPAPGPPAPVPHPPAPPAAVTPRRSRMPAWAWLLLALGVLLFAALVFVTVTYLMPANSQSGVAPTQPTLTPTTPAQPTPTETTKPLAPAPIVLPDCEALSPEYYARAAEFSARMPEIGIQYGNVGFARFPDQFGPAAQAALGASVQSQGCTYPTNLESGIWMYTMELPAAPREALLAALRADGDFVESSSSGTQLFVWEEPQSEFSHWSSVFTTHALVGDVWVVSYGPNPPETHIPQATAAILAANPGLG